MALGLLKVSKNTEIKIKEKAKEKKCLSSTIINEELIKWINNEDTILEYDNLNNENISLYFKTNTKVRNIANKFMKNQNKYL